MTDEIAPGYRSEVELSPGTQRCVDPTGRRWVLKRVPDDCLYAGGLHPAIRERLARVRELAHARVATLAGVVRGHGDAAWLVWRFVDGVSLDRAEASPAVASRLAGAVRTLHARGLVHGAITAGNVIVTPAGDVWLTHLSPYLWDDPAVDSAAAAELLGSTGVDEVTDAAHPPDRGRAWAWAAAAAVVVAALGLAVVIAAHLGR